MRNGNFLKIRFSEIRVKQIRVNQGLGVGNFSYQGMADSAIEWSKEILL